MVAGMLIGTGFLPRLACSSPAKIYRTTKKYWQGAPSLSR
jgi:hypothetical protein